MSKLKQLRKEKGITQKELSVAAGVPLRLIRAYETEERNINKASGKTLYLLSCALQTSIENLLELSSDEYKKAGSMLLPGK